MFQSFKAKLEPCQKTALMSPMLGLMGSLTGLGIQLEQPAFTISFSKRSISRMSSASSIPKSSGLRRLRPIAARAALKWLGTKSAAFYSATRSARAPSTRGNWISSLSTVTPAHAPDRERDGRAVPVVAPLHKKLGAANFFPSACGPRARFHRPPTPTAG